MKISYRAKEVRNSCLLKKERYANAESQSNSASSTQIRRTTTTPKYRTTCRVDDQEYVVLQVRVPTKKGERTFTWGGIPLKTITCGRTILKDNKPTEVWADVRADLIRRLQADTCELCGSERDCEVHHVHKLVDIKRYWAGQREKPQWVQKMIEMRRKTLVVCTKCHLSIHNGIFDLQKNA